MQPADFTALKAELTSDPLQLGYAAADNAGKAALLRGASSTSQGPIPMSQVVIWAARTGVRTRLEAHAANAADPLNSAALAVLDAFKGGLPTLDVNNPAVATMLGAFQQAGDFTAQQQTDLLALGVVNVARWKTLGLSESPQEGDVAHALTL